MVTPEEGAYGLGPEAVDTLKALVNQQYLPAMDVIPWLLMSQNGSLNLVSRAQWALRLARHAWLLGNKDK
jgi:hypothetical protein